MEIRPFSRFDWLMVNGSIRPFSTIQSPRFALKSTHNRHRNHLHIHQVVFGVYVGFREGLASIFFDKAIRLTNLFFVSL